MAHGRSKPICVGLVQINNSFSGQSYLPYSVACLESYVLGHAPDPDRYRFLLPIYKRKPIREIVDHLAQADVVGFSIYVWNAMASLEAARRLKQRRPDQLIIFGGPHVPDDAGPFLEQHQFIDVVAHNEGERSFLAFLERWPDRDWSTVPGVTYRDAAGCVTRTAPAERIRDLDELPSPFLQGRFDGLMRAFPEEHWIGLWETNRGCPFKCTFCDWGSATAARVNKFGDQRLREELDWFAAHAVEYIFVCDANFGIQKRDLDIARYVAEVRARTGYPHGFSVQNTKNATERAYASQKILADAGLNKGVALSMQSLDPHTLSAIKRDNISLETYLELARRFSRDGVETYSDLILALPGETYASFCEGVNLLIEAGQHNRIQFNNLSILPNAEMAGAEYRRTHGLVTVRSEIINIHGSRERLDDDVLEYQDLVIATAAMPTEDWRRTRSFSWMAAFLHFDKILQLPLILCHEMTGIPYRALFEAFLTVDGDTYPVMTRVRDRFLAEAASIQNGGPEYVFSEEWLGIYWPADEYMFIDLTVNGRMGAFYTEAARLLHALTADAAHALPSGALDEAVRLNRALLSQPFVTDDLEIDLDYDLLRFWDGVRAGKPVPLTRNRHTVLIERSRNAFNDLNEWCRRVVWWGNKKGAYLYRNRVGEPQLAGHY